jgi:hypothetical protein
MNLGDEMKAFGTGMKVCLGLLGLGSVMVLAESFYDYKFYSSSFMYDKDYLPVVEGAIAKRKNAKSIIRPKARKNGLPHVLRLSMGPENASKVNGEWEVTRILDQNKNVVFDKFDPNRPQDKNSDVSVNLEMIKDSTVRIDEDDEQIFKISLLTNHNTIVLFKKYEDGFEILEARRKKRNFAQARPTGTSQYGSTKQAGGKPKYHIEEELYLVSALDPARSRKILRGNEIEGRAILRNGELIIEDVKLHVGSQNESQSTLSIDTRIKGHGAFNYDNEIHGIVSTIQNRELKVRFSTGPLANAMLNFVTQEKYDRMMAQIARVPAEATPQAAAPAVQQRVEKQEIEQEEVVDGEEKEIVENEEYEENENVEVVDGERESQPVSNEDLDRVSFAF